MTEAALEELLPTGDQFAVRVMVTDAWDQVVLPVTPTTTVAEVKRRALAEALRSDDVRTSDYIVKFHGGQVLDESVTLASAGAGPNAPFIVLPARRRPVR
jgi:hypothetical protein